MCSRVAGGDEPPSVLSDNLHKSDREIESPGLQAGLLCCGIAQRHAETPSCARTRSPSRLVPGRLQFVTRRWSRCHRTATPYPCRDRVTGLDRCSRGPTKDIPARVGPCPPECPPVEARQTRICRASPPSSSAPRFAFDFFIVDPRLAQQPGQQQGPDPHLGRIQPAGQLVLPDRGLHLLHVEAVDVHVLPSGGGPRTAGAGDRPRRQPQGG